MGVGEALRSEAASPPPPPPAWGVASGPSCAWERLRPRIWNPGILGEGLAQPQAPGLWSLVL